MPLPTQLRRYKQEGDKDSSMENWEHTINRVGRPVYEWLETVPQMRSPHAHEYVVLKVAHPAVIESGI